MNASDVIGYTVDGLALCLEHALRRLLSAEEIVEYLAGHATFDGAEETPDGVTVPLGTPVFADTAEALATECDVCVLSYRLEVERDGDAEAPDWDGLGYVYRIPSVNVDRIILERSDYGTENGAPYLGDIIREHGAVADIAEAVAQLEGVASVDYIDGLGWRDDAFLFVVTEENASTWSAPRESWSTLASDARRVWQQWLDGDVWAATVLERTVWTSEDGRTMTTWEVVEAVCGFYGHDYAQEEGRALLAPFVTLGRG